jgi:hypothetical protein
MPKMDNVNRSSMVLAAITIVIVRGASTGISQVISLFPNAYAHTFTPDDSASFLALIYRIKNEAQLVQDNLQLLRYCTYYKQ